jgi:hypothetical protein
LALRTEVRAPALSQQALTNLKLCCLVALLTVGACYSLQAAPQQSDPIPQARDGVVATGTQAEAPKIEFQETSFDFGRVFAGELVRHEFVFTNMGSSVLQIFEVMPHCGCTVAGMWDREIEPHKTGIIPLQFNSSAFSGLVAKTATLTCNDPITSNVVLQITGTVFRPIEISPVELRFDISDETQGSQMKLVRIVSNLSEPLELSELYCTNAAFRAELKTVQPGKEYELGISVVQPLRSSLSSTVTLKTSSVEMPNIGVNISATQRPVVEVSPESVSLPQAPLQTAVTSTVAIQNYSTNAIELSEAQVNVAGVKVTLHELEPTRSFSLTADFPAGFQLPRDKKVELSVRSSHPKFHILKVPILQIQPETPVIVHTISPTTRVIPTRPPPETAAK